MSAEDGASTDTNSPEAILFTQMGMHEHAFGSTLPAKGVHEHAFGSTQSADFVRLTSRPPQSCQPNLGHPHRRRRWSFFLKSGG